MADSSVVVDQLPSSIPNPKNSSADFDSLPIPPFDPQFLASDSTLISDQDFALDCDGDFNFWDNCDFGTTFDVDNPNLHYLPSENEAFIIPDAIYDPASSNGAAVLSISASPESASSTVFGDKYSHVADEFLNYPTSENSQNSADPHHSNISTTSNIPSPSLVSSQGSGVSQGLNSPDRDISSEVKLEEEIGKSYGMSKRKKEEAPAAAADYEDGNAVESRTTKYRRSSAPADNANSHLSLNEEDEKRKARLMRNRESAQLSRQRKKHYVEELEDKVRSMHSTITDLNSRISYIMAENATLRQQLSGGAMCPPPGMYPQPPMPPMAYPWMPCTPYVVKPQGSHVPLVPIPRLKPQTQPQPQPQTQTQSNMSASKGKKPEGRKTEGKTKKVASVSFLGLLFFFLLFGALVPIVNLNFGGLIDKVPIGSGYVSERFYDHHRGRVLTVTGHMNGSDDNIRVGISKEKFDGYNRIPHERQKEQKKERPLPGSDEFVRLGNASEPLVASLYVPRNDKLVKIDGNLIIHSVLASEKAKASHARPEVNNNYALAIPKARGNRGRHAPLYANPTERQKALTSGADDTLKDHLKSTAADGKLQQWFREGLAGPMLSSGMCTEVFQFDVSPASGAIVPASSVSNVTTEHHKNNTRLNKRKNRRTLHNLPAPFAGSNNNITEDRIKRNLQKDNCQGNRSVSSMVVSVLVDPREGSESDVDGVITPKSLPRIFVVVLIDSVKYVTYSCVLPRATGPHHLVTT
ncbi:bZIP transcription factor 17 [Ziziphus jujuba]|uniref:BZIP transcription factor 17 n=1 Tax=Ziziphus jujuba TaxID=326968 RepID=A0A6P4ANT2_ZIZJJ|nr:bZIP transcription factor 17 [Ziziphus jujuba]